MTGKRKREEKMLMVLDAIATIALENLHANNESVESIQTKTGKKGPRAPEVRVETVDLSAVVLISRQSRKGTRAEGSTHKRPTIIFREQKKRIRNARATGSALFRRSPAVAIAKQNGAM